MNEGNDRRPKRPSVPAHADGGLIAAENVIRELPHTEILEAVPDAMVVVNETGHIVYVNMETERLFGHPRAELLGKPIEILIPHTYRATHVANRQSYVASPRTRFMGQALDIVGQRRDGTEFPADVKLSPAVTTAGTFVIASVRDITERKEKEQLRAHAAELEALKTSIELKNVVLEQQNRELEQFAYVASHDLQEPLRKIIAFGDRLKAQYTEALGEKGQDYLSRMQSAAHRMQQLIAALLGYSRITTRVRPFSEVDLREIVAGALSDLELAIEREHGHVDVGPLGVVQGDPVLLRQLFQNIIGNALKFHAEGRAPKVVVRGNVTSQGPGKSTQEVRIEDDGIGIDPQYFERIFNVFERLNGQDRYPGTGIGLAICKKIVVRHGGMMTVESSPGKGTTFVVRLPACAPNGGSPS